MLVRHIRPGKYLEQYVDRYWSWESEGSEDSCQVGLFPGTGVELVFHYSSPFKVLNCESLQTKLPHCHIICLRKNKYHIECSGNTGFIAVRFRVGAFRHFSGNLMKELADSLAGADQIWGKTGRELGDMVAGTKGFDQKIEIIEDRLMELLGKYHKPDKEIDYIAKRIYYGYKCIRIGETAAFLNVSNRHLERRFKETLGVSPKFLHSVSRFQATLKYLLLNGEKDYLYRAIESGYYDQSHFVKEFRRFVGEKPSSFLHDNNFRSHFYNKKLLP